MRTKLSIVHPKESDDEPKPRKANECIADGMLRSRGVMLFDAFWQEGELALMFGPPGAGKSVLAVQIAEAVARGRAIEGFRMPGCRRKVLYVDLSLSDHQFSHRYSYRPGENRDLKNYKFSESMFRERPSDPEKLFDWLDATVRKNKFQVVIIDDLSAVKQTSDGTRETLKLIRQLKRLKDELGVSILVLAGATEPRKKSVISEADLGRSRVLADTADSVFAVGRHPKAAGKCYLAQTRSRTAALVWNEDNAPVGRIEQTEPGFLGMAFDERFAERIDDETRQRICKIKTQRNAGARLQTIADEFGISVSTVSRLLKKWSPDLESGESCDSGESREWYPQVTDELDEWDEAEYEKPYWLELAGQAGQQFGEPESQSDQSPPVDETRRGMDAVVIPFAAGLRRRTIYDLEIRLNEYGKEMYVVKWSDATNKPELWYSKDRNGNVTRWTYGTWGPQGNLIGKSDIIDRWEWLPSKKGRQR